MRTKQKAAVPFEQVLAREGTEAYDDTRALAIELARGVPSALFDPDDPRPCPAAGGDRVQAGCRSGSESSRTDARSARAARTCS